MSLKSEIQKEENHCRHVLDAAASMIWVTGRDGVSVYFNKSWLDFTGRTLQQELALKWSGKEIHPENQQQCLDNYITGFKNSTSFQQEYQLKNSAGDYRWILEIVQPYQIASGAHTGFVGNCIDITERKQAETIIQRLAYYDALTGLPNRTLFNNRLDETRKQANRHDTMFALMYLDLDHFKKINDSLGHLIGDELLKSVGQRLTKTLREIDTIARLGGDEFAIIAPDIKYQNDVSILARKIIEIMTQPFMIDNQELYSSTSVGVTLYRNDNTTIEHLNKQADIALYHAKALGRNRYVKFDDELNATYVEKLTLEKVLRRALDRSGFTVLYQPKLDLKEGTFTGVEALLRLPHGDTVVLPTKFIPIAEETGLIIKVGEWVLRTACRQVKAWEALGFPGLSVAVNFSPRQFRETDLLTLIDSVLQETELAPAQLEIEITESVIMEDSEQAVNICKALKERGIQLSIDDFGTGYSSLNYLKRFPIDTLKIDRSFITDLATDPADLTVVTSVIGLAHGLGLKVIAEGVETKQQMNILREEGCDEIQGFFVGHPITAENFAERWLNKDKSKRNTCV